MSLHLWMFKKKNIIIKRWLDEIIQNHLFGTEAILQTPQVFPPLRVMYPASPHEAPQEFLITQFPSFDPVRVTPWLRLVLQLLKTPVLYGDQLVASTATETTPFDNQLVKSLQLVMLVCPEIFQSPPSTWHFPPTPLYGYLASRVIPLSWMYLKEFDINPPLHPWFPYELEQSTSCCSEKLWRSPHPSLLNPSKAPVVEKAQHDPHCPWFLTGVTAPAAFQSTSAFGMCSWLSISTSVWLGINPR